MCNLVTQEYINFQEKLTDVSGTMMLILLKSKYFGNEVIWFSDVSVTEAPKKKC